VIVRNKKAKSKNIVPVVSRLLNTVISELKDDNGWMLK
jgi:uncharacterized lipoprotein YajG